MAWWQQVLIAVGATSSAWVVRIVLSPVLLDQSPYHLFFVSVLLTGLFCGWELSILAAIAGGVVANIAFVPPYGHLALDGKFGWGFTVYLLTAIMIVWLARSVSESFHRESALSEHLKTVSEEYRHRIKNLLAMTMALVSQTARHTASMTEFEDKVVGRLQALAKAQDLLSNPNDRSIPIRRLLHEILTPFNVESRLAWSASSPDVEIPSEEAVSLALIFNELATNATKYGALSAKEGRLQIDWTTQNSWLIFRWRERDGPPVVTPAKRGFGSRLFDQALSGVSGKTTIGFDPDGLVCEIKLAIRQ
jgi:two-component sensor histidine kinase